MHKKGGLYIYIKKRPTLLYIEDSNFSEGRAYKDTCLIYNILSVRYVHVVNYKEKTFSILCQSDLDNPAIKMSI
jgi:hypothetical protein